MTFDIKNNAINEAYVKRWFVEAPILAKMAGCEVHELHDYNAAGICPRMVYALTPEGWWWSALGELLGRHGTLPEGSAHYYSPAAAWWLRRAVLLLRHGHSVTNAATSIQDIFYSQFKTALVNEPLASQNYTECFDQGVPAVEAILTKAKQEWHNWINGGYAVCLHHFTGQSCVEKETLRFVVVQRLEKLSTVDDFGYDLETLALVERLSALMLPFAPWERALGTPGKTIDHFLKSARLGRAMA